MPDEPELGFHPDQKEVSGLFCFLDASRSCGADCMAYLSTPPDGKDYDGQQWANCHLLVNMHRGGKHLVVLATTASQAHADKQRLNQKQPPPVK